MKSRSAAIEAEAFINNETFGGPSNDDICGRVVGSNQQGHVNSPTGPQKIYERERRTTGSTWNRLAGYRLRPLTFTALVRLSRDLETSLEASATTPGFHDVYAVTRPDLAPVGFYGLFDTGRDLLHTSKKLRRHRTSLKDEDLSTRETGAYSHLLNSPGTCLLAYHIGQTDCEPEEIKELSEWIISRLSSYSFFSNNCQHFALALCARILCRRRNHAVFLGTKLQIVEWDRKIQGGGIKTHKNGFKTGFCLATPCKNGPSSWLKMYNRHFHVDVDSYQLGELWPQGETALLPDDILEYSVWRRQLAFRLVTNTFPKVRLLLFKEQNNDY
ncbi:MAG: hypothetical protein M1834_009356 [Cirrosporium novae-zelandiae]|nr:MAG: hypothetical protein M1834_009356 [Cirrosporium novae-zelandiae]